MNPEHAVTFAAQGRVPAITMPNIKVQLNQSLADLFKVIAQEKSVTALWDTGASKTCISNKLADELGLPPTSMVQMHGAGGMHPSRVFKVDLTIMDRIKIVDVEVCEFIKSDSFDVLIGMDIICIGDIAITNADGNTVFSYQIPPASEHIDFVKQVNERNQREAARAAAPQALKSFKKHHRRKH